jgi:hypothetical protein
MYRHRLVIQTIGRAGEVEDQELHYVRNEDQVSSRESEGDHRKFNHQGRYVVVKLWNPLPANIPNPTSFKMALKIFLFIGSVAD